jgi:hypothetical protein
MPIPTDPKLLDIACDVTIRFPAHWLCHHSSFWSLRKGDHPEHHRGGDEPPSRLTLASDGRAPDHRN